VKVYVEVPREFEGSLVAVDLGTLSCRRAFEECKFREYWKMEKRERAGK
jgi:hypothetical protein